MRTKDSDLMKRIIDFFNNYYVTNGTKPTTRIIGAELGINASTVSKYLREMSERGLLKYENGEAETDITSKVDTKYVSVPLVGTIACGLPCLAEENIEGYYRFPEKLFGKGEFFILHASGDSMINAGIEDGDLVIVRKSETAKEGQIVVALTAESENTLKRYYPEPRKHQVRLKADNPKYQDIITSSCKIQGVAIKIIKNIM